MMVVVLLGAPVPARAPRRRLSPLDSGSRVLASGDLLRAAVARRDRRSAARRDRYMSRGQLVPDEITIVHVFLDRLAGPRRRSTARSSTGSRGTERPGRGARRRARRPRAAASTARCTSTSRSRTSSSACRAAGSARRTGTSTTWRRTRRRSQGICDLDGSPLRPARRRRRGDRPGAAWTSRSPPLLEVVDHYRRRGVLATVDGTVGIAGADRRPRRGPRRRRARGA